MSPSISASSVPSAMASARLGMHRSMQRVDGAAGRIARFGLDANPGGPTADTPPPAAVGPQPQAAGDDLAGAMVDMRIAQRAFAASLRALEAASEMSEEAVNLGQAPDAARTTP